MKASQEILILKSKKRFVFEFFPEEDELYALLDIYNWVKMRIKEVNASRIKQ